jgi:hypothetical protein
MPTQRSVREPLAPALGLLVVVMGGCTSPSDPVAPPGGGQEFVLDYAAYAADVAPVLEEYGCHAVECHGGGIRGTYELSPPDELDPAFDFEQTVLQVDPWNPDESPVLVKPLDDAAGGVLHSWEPFDSPEHEGYVAIREWILAGEFR